MKKKELRTTFRKSLLTILGLLLTVSMYGQKQSVTGFVTDENKEPLPGANILEKGTKNGTQTDFDGNYNLDAVNGATLVVSYLGYKTQEIVVANQSVIHIQMIIDAANLEEVVVIGYGSELRKELTTSIGSVNTEELQIAPVDSFEEALAGRVAGVQVTSSQGRPGASSSIKIRGTGSLTQDSSPLFVIDGFPNEDFDLSSIPSSDIQELQILKGPSAIAVYGARGGNGVVLITTVGGVKGTAKITYNSYHGVRQITKRMDVLSPYDFVDLQFEVDSELANNKYGPLTAYLKSDGTSVSGIDWQSEVFQDTEVHNHALSVSGGNSDTTYNLSFNNYTSTGLLPESGFERSYLKFKLGQKVTKKIKIGANISYTKSQITGTGTSTNIVSDDPASTSSSARFNLLRTIIQNRPTGGLFYSNEDLLSLAEDEDPTTDLLFNPLINALSQVREDKRHGIFFNSHIKYTIFNGLTLKVNAGMNKTFKNRSSFDAIGSAFYQRTNITQGSLWNEESLRTSISSTLYYEKKLGKNRINALLGYEYNNREGSGSKTTNGGFPESNNGLDDLGAGTIPGIPSSYRLSTNKLISVFYRFNYSYGGKYFVTNTLRRDGSSKFGKNNKFGLFPSMSVAWKFSSEAFVKKIKNISEGKLRFEWGQVGNNRIPGFVSTALLNSTTYGANNGIQSGVFPANLANTDIKWEAQESVGLGLDLGLFDDRVYLNVDLYSRTSKDLLLRANLPTSIGYTTIFRNVGKIRNGGLELALSTVNIDKDFKWNTSVNLTIPKRSKTLALVEDDVRFDSSGWAGSGDNDTYPNDYITRVGQPFGLMYGYVDDGLYGADDFDTNGDAFINVAFNDEVIGYRKYRDISGPDGVPDNIIDENDKKVIGDPNPDFYGSISNTFKYKGFDLNIYIQGSYGNDIYNANRLLWTQNLNYNQNYIPEVLNRWRTDRTPEENVGATFRSIDDVSNVLTSQYIEDGSFIRLKTVALGYTFPVKWVQKIGANKLRVYVSGQNLYTWTKYTGFDPEVSTRGSGLTAGVDYGAYPRTKTFIGGLTVSF